MRLGLIEQRAEIRRRDELGIDVYAEAAPRWVARLALGNEDSAHNLGIWSSALV